MNRKPLMWCLAFILAFSMLAGCSGGNTSGEEGSSGNPSSKDKVELSFWLWMDWAGGSSAGEADCQVELRQS